MVFMTGEHAFRASAVCFGLMAACSPANIRSRSSMTSAAVGNIAVVVEVEIAPDRIDDFLKVMEGDAIGSRERENGGCLRFDVLRDQERSNVFRLYELYRDRAALDFHKEQPHFLKWREFKASGGVISQKSALNDAIFVA
ncbi:hypothetical protein KFE25_006934 [Diacronema lutheri]|uniref:ABM domain-containing protein n=1 Tax=Diacronema lutheri TaxID=2081491 RepID=A0A8J5XT21_DIALT|nr:hypothetical protein KFE25_006934 [Diacronema lutheri]